MVLGLSANICLNSAFLMISCVAQQWRGAKHSSFGPVWGSKMDRHFQISWILAVFVMHQWSHEHLQSLLDSKHILKIRVACIWRSLQMLLPRFGWARWSVFCQKIEWQMQMKSEVHPGPGNHYIPSHYQKVSQWKLSGSSDSFRRWQK